MDFFEPVRNPVKKTKGSYPGYVPSLKEDRMVATESTIERDFAILVEADPFVKRYSEQPIAVEYVLDGKKHKHTPDFAISRNGQIIFVQVKPEAKASDPENVRKFAAIREACARHGYRFIVLTEMEILRQPRLRNAEILHHAGRSSLSGSELDAIVSELNTAGIATVETLSKRLGRIDPTDATNAIYGAIRSGRLKADMSQPLGPNAQLCLAY